MENHSFDYMDIFGKVISLLFNMLSRLVIAFLPRSKRLLISCCTQYASKFGKLSSGYRTGKGQFAFQSQRKAMPKNVQTTTQLHSTHILAN